MLVRCGVMVLAALAADGTLAESTPERFDIRQLDREAVRTFRKAWETAGLGNRDLEALVLVVEDIAGRRQALYRGPSREYRSARFSWDPRTVAIVHTHPNRSSEKPSTQDRALADRMGVPVYTLTNRGLWGYDPSTKKTALVMDGMRWFHPKNWNKTPAE